MSDKLNGIHTDLVTDKELNITEHFRAETELLLQLRKNEILERNFETETKSKFIETKSVTDQFTFIYNISMDIRKCVDNFIEKEKA